MSTENTQEMTWKERVIAEQEQLVTRLSKLNEFLIGVKGSEVTDPMAENLRLMQIQADQMQALNETLSARIALFDKLPG